MHDMNPLDNHSVPVPSSMLSDDPTTFLVGKKMHTRINSADSVRTLRALEEKNMRLVVVRYFLDRPGYGLHNSAARLWFHPPSVCLPCDVLGFLKEQGILMPDLLVEVYLDKFQSFMLIEACAASLVEWDFSETTYLEPGIINIRLTDLAHAEQLEKQSQHGGHPPKVPLPSATNNAHPCNHANTTPLGLFSFSFMVGLETVALMADLFPDAVDPSFRLAWGPYMLFAGGLLQFTVGTFQVLRNNIYGATAFLAFGCFWFANGTIAILSNHYSPDGTLAHNYVTATDPLGFFLRQCFMLGFSCVLLTQTFVMNRLSTSLIALLCLKILIGSLTGWLHDLKYAQLVIGWMTSILAFYVFLVELTNQVYQRQVFPTYKWSEKDSPEEAFGAAGRPGTLESKATRLRNANFSNPRKLRSVLPLDAEKPKDE